jgi:glutamate/aspartate transport system substrate-binding protein
MNKVKFIVAICVAALTVAPLASRFARPAAAQELEGTLKKIKDSGAITIGYRESSVPFSYIDDNQKPVGFADDICAKIVDAVKAKLKLDKLEVKFNPVTSATRIPLIANGTVDLECGSTTNNPDREKQVAFTNSHFLSATRWLYKKTNKIVTLKDMAGKTVVSTAGTTNIKQLNEANTKFNLGINIVSAKDHSEAFLMVETDRAVAFVMDDILLAGFKANSRDPKLYAISDDTLSRAEPYGIMLRRGDPSFKAVADKATADLYTSPEIKTLYDKWFTKPINSHGLNLDYPMTPTMTKMFAHPSDSGDPAAYAP